MSSESDKVIFENSVEPYDSSVLFKDKSYVYLTDNSSNGGVFNGQLQWDLGVMSSQSSYLSLKDAILNFPIRVRITNTGSGAQTPVSSTVLNTVLKNGFYQFIDSVSLVVNGQTLQNSQIYENIACNFRVLTEFSKDELAKNGNMLGIALDRWASTSANPTLNNVSTQTYVPQYKGFDMTGVTNNPAIWERQVEQNVSVASTALSQDILTTSSKILGKSAVGASTGAIAVNSDCYTQFVIGSVRLSDICPAVRDMPLTKNLSGFLYVNYNASQSTLISNASGVITSITSQNIYGRTVPVMLNNGASGFQPGNSATWRLTAELSAVSDSTTVAGVTSPLLYARLICPQYVGSPSVDSALSMKKTWRFQDRTVTSFQIGAGQNQTITLSPGIANPRKLVIYPYFSKGYGTYLQYLSTNPIQSLFSPEPSTTSPFCALSNIQISVGNIPVFNSPVNFDIDLFNQELATLGLDGGEMVQANSGLLSADLYDTLYRYITCDIGRRLDSEDGSSKSVIFQANNATTCDITCIAFVYYDKEVTIDTSTSVITQGR